MALKNLQSDVTELLKRSNATLNFAHRLMENEIVEKRWGETEREKRAFRVLAINGQ